MKVIFLIAAIVGVVAIFFVSWFWRGLLIPMVILLFADVFLSLFKKKPS